MFRYSKGKISTGLAIFIIISAAILVGGIILREHLLLEIVTLRDWWISLGPLKERVLRHQTMDWETYQIENFGSEFIGYEVKYPPDFELKEWTKEELKEAIPVVAFHAVTISKEGFPGWYHIITAPAYWTAKEYAEQMKVEGKVISSMKVAEVPAKKVVYVKDNQKGVAVWVVKDEKSYYFSYNNHDELGLKRLHQILFTFQFLEK